MKLIKEYLSLILFFILILIITFYEVYNGSMIFLSGDSLSPIALREGINKVVNETNLYPLWLPWIFSGMPSIHSFINISNLKSSEDKTAWDIMIASPDVLHPEDTIEKAVDVIDYFGYRYMPVVDSQGSLMGIVDARELHRPAKIKAKKLLEAKDSILSYMMGSEPYGRGAVI